MATNWKKILFGGANIEITSITASDVPTLLEADFNSNFEVVSAFSASDNSDEFRFNKINQSGLQNLNGGTQFLISGGGDTSNTFESNGNTLNFTTSNPTYVTFTVDGDTNAGVATASFNPSEGYITGSGQINAISYSLDLGLSNVGQPIGWNDFYTAFWTNGIQANSQSAYENAFYVTNTDGYANVTTAQLPFSIIDSYTTADGSTITPTALNLWRNEELNIGSNTYLNPPSNPQIAGKRTYYWLSASYVGGFSDGTQANSASYADFSNRTGSISASFASVINSSASLATVITDAADSGFVDNEFKHLKTGSEFIIAKQVTDPVTGQLVDQVTITHYDEDDASYPQGFQVELGDANNNLVIPGLLSASAINFTGDGDVALQINVEAFNSDTPDYDQGVSIGTTTANSHSFTGNVFVSGANVDVIGDVNIASALPSEDLIPDDSDGVNTNITPAVLLVNSNDEIRESEISSSNALTAIISGSALDVSESLAEDFTSVVGNIGSSTTATQTILNLQGGYSTNGDSLETIYSKGFGFGTSSDDDAFALNTINSRTTLLTKEAAFNAMSASGDATTIIKWTESPTATGSELTLTFSSESFVDVSGIFTGSNEIKAAVEDLNRYGLKSSLILTASDTTTNLNYIAQLPANGPGPNLVGSDATTRFITGAGAFLDLDDTPSLGNITDETATPSQAVLEFNLDDDNDATTPVIYQFGVTASNLGPTDSPTFNNLTIDDGVGGGDLTIEGNIVYIDTTDLLVEDQFVMVNSGALKPPGVANPSGNDKDGGILVAGGNGSGSAFMYDFSDKRWGIVGATGANDAANKLALDAQSFDGNPIIPEAIVRTIVYVDTANPTYSDLPTSIGYGVDDEANVGTFALSQNDLDTNGDLFIHVGG